MGWWWWCKGMQTWFQRQKGGPGAKRGGLETSWDPRKHLHILHEDEHSYFLSSCTVLSIVLHRKYELMEKGKGPRPILCSKRGLKGNSSPMQLQIQPRGHLGQGTPSAAPSTISTPLVQLPPHPLPHRAPFLSRTEASLGSSC